MTIVEDEYTTHSAEETIALGRRLAPHFEEHDAWSFFAAILVRARLRWSKVLPKVLQAASQDDVTSPTFTLIHEYRGPDVNLFHVDLYRVDTPRELDTLGLDELFSENGNLVLLEWGEKFPRFETECDAMISIERRGDQERRILITRK